MNLPTRFRSLITSEYGPLLQLGLVIALMLGVWWLFRLEHWGNEAVRILFGILAGAAIVSALVAHHRKRRSGVKTRTLRQTILTRPWEAVATVVWLPTTVAFFALVLRDGFAPGADANLRAGLGGCCGLLGCFLRLANGYYDWRDEGLAHRQQNDLNKGADGR